MISSKEEVIVQSYSAAFKMTGYDAGLKDLSQNH